MKHCGEKSTSSSISLSVILCTYRNDRALDAIFSALSKNTEYPLELIISEDSSHPDTANLFAKWQRNTAIPLLHCSQEDRGFRKSRILNEAIRRSSGEYIVFLDGDCIPDKWFIQDHQRLAEKKYFVQGRRAFIDQSAVSGYLQKKYSLLTLFFMGKLHGTFKAWRLPFPFVFKDRKMKGILGCNLGMWKEDLMLVNGFNERFEGWGGEDSELCARLYNLGNKRKIVYGHCRVYHLNHAKEDKSHYPEALRMLDDTVRNRIIKCRDGIYSN